MTPALFLELRVAAKAKQTCDIVEALYEAGQKVALYTADTGTANKLNLLLWSWKQETFIPHVVYEHGLALFDPVILFGGTAPPPLPERVLLMYDPLPLDRLEGYARVIDFAEVYHEQKRQEGRQRYKAMRDSGRFDLQFMTLGAFLARENARR